MLSLWQEIFLRYFRYSSCCPCCILFVCVLISLYCWTDVAAHSLDTSNSERLQTLIQMTATDLANSVIQAGHQYAMGHAASSLLPSAQLGELFGGMTQVRQITLHVHVCVYCQVTCNSATVVTHQLSRYIFPPRWPSWKMWLSQQTWVTWSKSCGR